MTADSHPSAEQLRQFDAGLLTPTTHAEVERHVMGCDQCGRTLGTLQEDPFVSFVRAASKAKTEPTVVGSEALEGPHDLPVELRNHPRYRVLDRIGAGGMGVVYRAQHRIMERIVALKILNRELTRNPAAVERFHTEVKAAARLTHPNIVTAHDADQAGEVHFLVSEYVEGIGLDRRLAGGAISVSQACDWARQTALALQHACEQGMIHRDIKPANLLLTPTGQVKVLDFGLARFLSESLSPALTPDGVLVGTPDYVAPEQARDPHQADIRADIYSLGCTLYHCLTAQVPFPGGAALQKLIAHQEKQPQPVSEFRSDVPAELSAILARMMAKDPAQRFQTPAEVAAALEPFITPTSDVPLSSGRLPRAGQAANTSPLHPRRSSSSAAKAVILAVSAVVFLGLIGLLFYVVTYRVPRPPSYDAATKNSIEPPASEKKADPPVKPPAPEHPVAAWIRENNTLAPNADLMPNVRARIASSRNSGIEYRIGSELLKSNQITFLGYLHGELFELKVPKDWTVPRVKPRSVLSLNLSQKDEKRVSDLLFQLSRLEIDNPEHVVRGTQITGTIFFKRLRKVDAPCGVRMKFTVGEFTYHYHMQLKKSLSTDTGTIHLIFPTEVMAKQKAQGPMMMYFYLTLPENNAREATPVVSNVLATLVRVEAEKEELPD